MRDGQPVADVAVADAERGAGDGVADAERAGGAAHERGLAGAELAAHEHDVAVAERAGQLGTQRFGLGGTGGFDGACGH